MKQIIITDIDPETRKQTKEAYFLCHGQVIPVLEELLIEAYDYCDRLSTHVEEPVSEQYRKAIIDNTCWLASSIIHLMRRGVKTAWSGVVYIIWWVIEY